MKCVFCGKQLQGLRRKYCTDRCKIAHQSALHYDAKAEREKYLRARSDGAKGYAPYTVYGLQDPRSMMIRYVGVSNSPGSRFYEHTVRHDGTAAKQSWIAELKKCGLVPNLIVLESAEDEQTGKEAEKRWIDYGISEGWELTNVQAVTKKLRSTIGAGRPSKSFQGHLG